VRINISKDWLLKTGEVLYKLGLIGEAGVIALSMVGCSESQEKPTMSQNLIGYSDVSPIKGMPEENFVILNIGNYKEIGVSFYHSKIKYCNKNDISLGIIIDSKAKCEMDIYNDVELAKGFIKDYTIDMPVYLNIDNIVENDSLSPEVKGELINNFLEKCSSNGMYVAVKGKDSNLVLLDKYTTVPLKEYDVYLVMDKQIISYKGSYTVLEDLEGNISAETNLSEVIKNKNLNSADSFVSDGAYIFKENDNIQEIAMRYGLSVDELLRFNNISKEDIATGTILRIPTTINTIVSNSENEFVTLTTPEIGIDISSYQGTDIDWEKVSSEIEFVILKVNEGNNVDKCFDINSRKCSEYNIPIGGYCFNAWLGYECENDTVFRECQIEQADKFLETVKNKNLEFPAYLDFELNPGIDVKDVLTNEQVKIMIDVWKEKMSSYGYIPGLYCSTSVYSELCSMYGADLSEHLEIWIAGGKQYIGDESQNFAKDEIIVPDSDVFTYDGKEYTADTKQVTNCGYGFGVGNSYGHVDVNFNYTDYTGKSSENTENINFDIKRFTRLDPKRVILGVGVALGVGVTSYVAVKCKKKRRINDEKKCRS